MGRMGGKKGEKGRRRGDLHSPYRPEDIGGLLIVIVRFVSITGTVE